MFVSERIKSVLFKRVQVPKAWLTLASMLFSIPLHAQLDVSYSSYSNQTEISATRSVTLTSGFTVPSGKTLRIFTTGTTPLLNGTPSSNQNYISTKIFKDSAVTELNINAARSVDGVNQTVQYFDGLGRLSQTVITQGSPGWKSIITPVSYDAFGREDKKYDAYVAAGDASFKADAISNQAIFYNSPGAGIQATSYAYSQTVYEASPLNRVLQQGFQGAVWQPASASISNSGHTVKTDYAINTATDAVKLWQLSGTGAKTTVNYAAGTLYKTVLKDENWTANKAGTTEEYKDFEGRVVLKKIWESETVSLSTYYVYDDFGNLAFVIPPAVTVSTFTEALTDTQFNQYIYAYRYDGRNRQIRKKIPGKGWEEFVYNPLDQVVFSQDSLQRVKGERTFFKYDALGRMLIKGEVKGYSGSRNTVQGQVDAQNVTVGGQRVWWESRTAGTGVDGYTTVVIPSNLATVANRRLHQVNYYDDYSFPNAAVVASLAIPQSNRTKGLVTGSKVYQVDGTGGYLSATYYDDYGRVLQTVSQHHLGGIDRVTNGWSFAGELKKSIRVHSHPTNGNTTITTSYTYDHMGRKLSTYESINGQASVLLSSNTYNELGQLTKKSLHNNLQSTAYAYNERGWLKNMTSNEFSEAMKYEDGTNKQYNGNIANQLWGAGASMPNTFTYGYDKLNRLLSGVSAGIVMSEVLTYDVMGNIKTLKRDAGAVGTYAYNGNRLTQITGGGATGAYGYDGNGNATTDGRNGVTLTYNSLNLPATVTKTGLSMSYLYDGTGNKLKKVSGATTRHYIGGIEYDGSNIEFIQTEEGIARNNGGNYSYEYNLKDHLGNVRASFYQNPSAGIEVLQRDNYYAFGLRKVLPPSSGNKYLYNGKELQEELNQYDYGARFYDPVIGRWTSVDPSAENDESYSPYIYVFDNPIRYTDPDGRWPDDGDPGVLSVTGNFAKGLGQSAWGTVTGVYGIVRHPINTATALGHAVSNPSQTAKAIGSAISKGYDDFQNGDANVKANIAGNVIGDVAQLFIGVGEAKAAVNSLRGVKVAEEAGQVAKVTEQVGKSSEYLNVTGANSLRNVKTNVNATKFGANLEASGFGKTVSKDGRATTYTKDNAKYSVRQSSQTRRGTKGASADYSNGTKKPTLKIRLGEQ